MRWPHDIVITRPGSTEGTQNPLTGAFTQTAAAEIVYDDKGFLWIKNRERRVDDDRDVSDPSAGIMYLKDRSNLWAIREGDIVTVADPKLETVSEGRVQSVDLLVGEVRVKDIRLIEGGELPTADGDEDMVIERLITAAELKTLLAAPIDLVPAPGVGRILVPTSMTLWYGGGVAYSTDIELRLNHEDSNDEGLISNGNISFSNPVEQVTLILAHTSGLTAEKSVALLENKALTLYSVSAEELADGDSPMFVRLTYFILEK
jgi:hypothetical protein